jgi:hypothetical protein
MKNKIVFYPGLDVSSSISTCYIIINGKDVIKINEIYKA